MLKISDEQWQVLYTFLCTCEHVYVQDEAKSQHFVDGVFWVVRTGAQWRALPKEKGNWNSVYKRFSRWCDYKI